MSRRRAVPGGTESDPGGGLIDGGVWWLLGLLECGRLSWLDEVGAEVSGCVRLEVERMERPRCWWMTSEMWRDVDVYPPRLVGAWSSGWGSAGSLGS